MSIFFFILYVTGTPIGILIGALVGSSGGIGFIIFIGMAGGIFIYMACCHLIIHEFHDSNDINELDKRPYAERLKTQRMIGTLKFLVVMLGFGIVVLVASIEDHH